MRRCLIFLALSFGLAVSALPAWGEDDKEARRQQLLQERDRIDAELKALDSPEATPAPAPAETESKQAEAPPTTMPTVEVIDNRLFSPPVGQAVSTVERSQFEYTKDFSVKDLTETAPGIFVKQGNGPRDFNMSIRGSGAKIGFGVRNIKVYEDWFPVTQSDGLSRTDITDPHAYGAVDIIRGPSSARYDNYALGGVVNFRQRLGREINGLEIGQDLGSFGYHNTYVTWGGQVGGFDYSLFGSYIGGDGYIDWSNFTTITENMLLTWAPDPTRQFTFKLINNNTNTNVPSRLSLNQWNADPFGAGTVTLSTAAGPSRMVGAQQADQSREDQRTIVGGRYSQLIAPDTTLTFTGVFDYKDIYQIFGTITDNQNPNWNAMLDLVKNGELFGLRARHYLGGFFNYMHQDASTLFNLGDYQGTSGGLQSSSRSYIVNGGGRAREELTFAPGWTLVLGLGGETSTVNGQLRNRTGAESFTTINVDRMFANVAPEASLIYRPTEQIITHFRVGTGYGIPNFSQLTTTSAGLPGNNVDLKAQQNLGVELGLDAVRLFGGVLDVSLTGYYEFFKNEFVTQSPGAGLSAFTTNAPHSQHRGVEFAAVLRPFADVPWWDGLYARTAYTFNDQFYTDYTEVINGVPFNRDGKQIPGVERSFLNGRIGYETPFGLGGYFEVNYQNSYFVNNSNTLSAPSYFVMNLDLHYAQDINWGWVKRMEAFLELQNLANKTYIGSAITVTDDVINSQASLANKQAFFSGSPFAVTGGMRLKF
ncbi:MAG TPA: TonB-dependent receptor [Candidatus Methylomirabilis sp.]|nr:TonB-dependent receptor [Candidatus Methylomirabilis sp.]